MTQQYVSQERLFELERQLSDVAIGQQQAQLAISQAQADIAELESQNLLQTAQFQRELKRNGRCSTTNGCFRATTAKP